MKFDWLRGFSNASLDLMRLAGAFVMFFAYPGPYFWELFKTGKFPDVSSYAQGWAVIFIAVGGAIFGKDIGVAKANEIASPTERSDS